MQNKHEGPVSQPDVTQNKKGGTTRSLYQNNTTNSALSGPTSHAGESANNSEIN